MELKVKVVKIFELIFHSLAIIVQALQTMMKACIITCTTLMTLAHPAWKIYSCTVVLVLPSLHSEQVCSLLNEEMKRFHFLHSFSTNQLTHRMDSTNWRFFLKKPKGLIGPGALKFKIVAPFSNGPGPGLHLLKFLTSLPLVPMIPLEALDPMTPLILEWIFSWNVQLFEA